MADQLETPPQQTNQEQSQQTSTTPQPSNPSNVELQLAEMQRMILQQQEEIARLGNVAKNVEAPQTQQPSPDFYTDPKGAIRDEVNRSVAPINEFIQTFQRTQIYQTNKEAIRNSYPQLSPYWSVISPRLDQIFGNGQVDPSFNNLSTAISNIVGQLTLQGNVPTQQPTNQQLPPSITPSAPLSPPPQNQQRPVILTEQQKVIARASGMTDEEFAQGLTRQTIIKV